MPLKNACINLFFYIMKLSKFDIEKKLSLNEIRSIKAGSASSQTSGNKSWSSGRDTESGDSENDY